jgi:hypothetical protein
MPKDMVRRQIEVDGEGGMVTNENGAVIIRVERLNWSNALVGETALMMGWPEFPGEDESLDRAHFFQAYRAEVSRMMEREGELPAVREYVLARRRNAALPPPLRSGDAARPFGQELKVLVERMEK